MLQSEPFVFDVDMVLHPAAKHSWGLSSTLLISGFE
jgi:hypothetical protein